MYATLIVQLNFNTIFIQLLESELQPSQKNSMRISRREALMLNMKHREMEYHIGHEAGSMYTGKIYIYSKLDIFTMLVLGMMTLK